MKGHYRIAVLYYETNGKKCRIWLTVLRSPVSIKGQKLTIATATKEYITKQKQKQKHHDSGSTQRLYWPRTGL